MKFNSSITQPPLFTPARIIPVTPKSTPISAPTVSATKKISIESTSSGLNSNTLRSEEVKREIVDVEVGFGIFLILKITSGIFFLISTIFHQSSGDEIPSVDISICPCQNTSANLIQISEDQNNPIDPKKSKSGDKEKVFK